MFSRFTSRFPCFSSSLPELTQLHRTPLTLTLVRHEIRPASPPPQLKLDEFQRRAAARRSALATQMAQTPPTALVVSHEAYRNPFALEARKAEEGVAARSKSGVYGQLYRQMVEKGTGVKIGPDSASNMPLPVPFFAIFSSRGFQYKVTEDDLLMVPRYPADIGQKILFNNVLLLGSPEFTIIGRPRVANAIVEATVEEQVRTQKVLIFHKKRRKGHRKFKGHRSEVTMLRINKIVFPPEHQSAAERVLAAVRQQQAKRVKMAAIRKIKAEKEEQNQGTAESSEGVKQAETAAAQ